jgi:hypothetical protein
MHTRSYLETTGWLRLAIRAQSYRVSILKFHLETERMRFYLKIRS